MGKKAERKTRAAAKQKQFAARSPKSVLQQSSNVESADDGVLVVKERKPCPHLDKGIDLDKISGKIGSSDPVRCKDCREGVGDRKGKKGRGKHGKKKGSASADAKSDLKAIWVCLDCGHYACGGVGLPTTPQSHVVRHARQTRHPLVIQWGNPYLRWCFPCDTLIPVEKTEENGENKDALSEVVKLIKGRSAEGSSVDVEDVWFGGGSVTSEIKSESTVLSRSDLDGNVCYVVRGLANLGNTCFFNSVMQNLLAMSRLRDYFLNVDASFGHLTIALKKLVAETKPETGLRNVINPRSFFGCVCSKAPQFRGYQQHDSHELLRCLLDGLCSEELGFRKRNSASEENGISSNQGPTFVDSVFGGKISSTVCCVECGHSSTVYEPFLDISLPIPTKKAPSKKTQPTSRAKKTKLPPKKSGRVRSKGDKDTDTVTTQSVSNPSASSKSQSLTKSTAPLIENVASSSGGSQLSDSVGSTTMATQSGSALQNFPADPLSEHDQVLDNPVKQTVASLVDSSWLDYLEPQTIADVHDSALQNSDVSVIQDSTDFAWLDYLEPQTISDEHDWTSQYNDVFFVQDSGEKDKVSDDSLINSNQLPSLDSKPNLKPDSSSGGASEDELPLVVQDSEVILLPFNEEISSTADKIRGEAEASSVASCGQEEVDFDGFGDLFNEPEIIIGPVLRPSLGSESVESGFAVGNSSDSDPDQVDDSNSPVSVASCLVHFIKPELLTDDNAWDCESCSKTLQRQKLEALKKRAKHAIGTLINGGEITNQNDLQGTSLTDVKTLSNGDIKTNIDLNTFSESSQNGKTDDCLYEDCACAGGESGQRCNVNPAVSQLEKGKMKMNDAVEEQSHSSSFHKSCSQESITDQAEASCSVDGATSSGCTADEVRQRDAQFGAGNRESEETKVEINFKNVKVKRDATKRVLINKAPPILTIHLKRFSQDARGRLSKLNGHVNFSEIINLRPYMDPRCTDHDNYDYRLVGVVEHLGTMRGGHYVAYVRGGPKKRVKAEKENVWYHASDACVREVSLEEVLRCEAYILFYEKI